jgi:hypothetical protein
MGKLKNKIYILATVAILILLVTVVAAGIALAPKPVLPKSITKQTTFTVFVPTTSEIMVDTASTKYDAKLKLLSYNATVNGIHIVLSMQPTPESFADIPQFYDKVVAKMNEYSKFESINGTVHLTRPIDLGGKQTAVVDTKGTLIFVKPESDLTDDQWRQFFKNIDVLR